MAYEVTATKKRPQAFDQVIGQEFVVSTLKSSLEQGRIAHAYLFSGPRGVGKTSAARVLAKALNCENGPGPVPCGSCTNCKEITQGNSLDVIEIDGASNTSVNDVREIKDEVLFAPSNSRYKIYIIDEVHMLSNSAFNALLKTIEEPPPYIAFIFATTEIHKVPATIRSRCQQFHFRLIPAEDIKTQLEKAAVDLGAEAESDALFWIAKEATGSLRDAYTLFDQVVSFSDGSITLEKITRTLGLVGFEKINTLAELIADGKTKEVLEYTDTIISSGVSIEQFVLDVAEYFRNLLFIRNGIKKESLLGCSIDRYSEAVRGAFSVQQLEEAMQRLLRLFRDIRFSLNQRFELELVLSRLSGLRDYIDQKEILAKIQELKSELLQGECPAPSEKTQDEPSASGVDQSTAGSETDRRDTTSANGAYPSSAEEGLVDECPTDRGPAAAMSGRRQPESPANSMADQQQQTPVSIDCKKLQQQLADALKQKITLATNIKSAARVEQHGNTISFLFERSYSASSTKQEAPVLIQKIEEITGHRFQLDFGVITNKQTGKTGEGDEQVELLKRVFRGQVVDEE